MTHVTLPVCRTCEPLKSVAECGVIVMSNKVHFSLTIHGDDLQVLVNFSAYFCATYVEVAWD